MKRTCICKICNCGRHHCSKIPTALYVKGDETLMQTEYTEKYPPYGIHHPARSLKPKQQYQERRGKMDGTTTFKSDYIPHEVMVQYVREQVPYKPSPGNMDLGTTYKLDFGAHKVQPFVPQRPAERSHVKEGRLDTLPTYKEDFRPWEVSKRDMTKPNFTYRPPSGKFGNATTFQDDFVPRGLIPRQSFKPPSVAKLSNAPFDALTSHRVAYVPHALEPKFVKPLEEFKPSSEPFQDYTTHRNDFQGLPGQPPKSCKPDAAIARSDVHFESCTEFRQSFKQWPLALPQLPKMLEYVAPMEPMDLNTTTKGDFIHHCVQPFVPVKPLAASKKSSAPFQASTTTKEDFRPWIMQRQEIMRRQEETRKASGKMEDLTTFKLHYTPHQLQPNISFKPNRPPLKTEASFDDGTMYRLEFTPKKMSMCPASFDCPPGYVFEDTDSQGHRLFRRVSPQDSNRMPVSVATEVAVMS